MNELEGFMHILTMSDLDFNIITLIVVWRIDRKSEKVQLGSPLRSDCNSSSVRYGGIGLA